MPTKIKHVALVSNNYALLGRFYEAVFGMKTSTRGRPESAVSVSDGYVGMNVNPRGPGRQGGFDHFGFEVEDAEAILARMREKYPSAHYLKRPSNRPFAGISAHDLAGNVFDLSQPGMENRQDVYTDESLEATRNECHISHFTLRTLRPDELRDFYCDVLELREADKAAGDPNFYLTDGLVTMVIAPWKIQDYLGTGIERPALDHLGFEVPSLEAFDAHVKKLAARNPYIAPRSIGASTEGEVRLRLLSTCRFGQYQLADPDGVLINVSEQQPV